MRGKPMGDVSRVDAWYAMGLSGERRLVILMGSGGRLRIDDLYLY